MVWIALIIALFALYIAYMSYSISLFDKRFRIYQEVITIFDRFLTMKFNRQQDQKVKSILTQTKFLFNQDKKITAIMVRAAEYSDFFSGRKEEKSRVHHPSKVEQEMLDWIRELYFSKDGNLSELEKAFEPYLVSHQPFGFLTPLKTLGQQTWDGVQSNLKKRKKR